MKTKKRVTSVTFSPTVDSGRARIWTQVRQNLYSSNHHHADLWGRARVWPACWVHRTEGQKEKHVLLLQCLLLSGLSARWSFGEPNPSHLLLSASDILIKCFGSLYHTIKMLSTFLSLGKKKCKLKFLSLFKFQLLISALDLNLLSLWECKSPNKIRKKKIKLVPLVSKRAGKRRTPWSGPGLMVQ